LGRRFSLSPALFFETLLLAQTTALLRQYLLTIPLRRRFLDPLYLPLLETLLGLDLEDSWPESLPALSDSHLPAFVSELQNLALDWSDWPGETFPTQSLNQIQVALMLLSGLTELHLSFTEEALNLLPLILLSSHILPRLSAILRLQLIMQYLPFNFNISSVS